MELAALLYLGDYMEARHCWRRHRDAAPPATKAALEEWWNLGRALIESDMPRVWAILNHLQASNNNSVTTIQPPHLCVGTYAQEIGAAVCRRLLPKLATLWDKHQQPDAVLLGLPRREWALFLEQHRKGLVANSNAAQGATSTDVISFLEGSALTV